MDKETIAVLLIILGLTSFMIIALLDLALPCKEEIIGTKILVDYQPKAFCKPSIARFDDGSIYLNIDFEGGICIGAKYKIVKLRSRILGQECGIKAIRCSE